MRGTRKPLSILVGCAALLSIGTTSIPTGRASTTAVSALQARRAQLIQQLASLQTARGSASSSVVAAENDFADAQARLLAARQRLASLNARLLALSGQVADDEATIARAKHELAALTRQSYETTSNQSWVAAVLSSSTFHQAMDRLAGTSHVAEQVGHLQSSVRDRERALNTERNEIRTDSAASTALEAQLALDSNRLLVVVDERNLALAAATGPERAIASEIAQLDQQIAAAQAPPAPPRQSVAPGGVNSGPCGDHFGYGQCTWYVASRRCIPWVGNADEWFARAAAMGYPEGHTPAVGAVVTFWPGGDGASSIGHVGYVEVVGPAAGVAAGYFKFSEMNFNGGWDRVSYRVLPNNSAGIQGFIYAK